jgi:hypothetical protein
MPFGGVIHGSNPCGLATPDSPREMASVKDPRFPIQTRSLKQAIDRAGGLLK